jgi:hypothetical protein
VGDRVKELFLFSDPAAVRLQGIYITLASNKRLNGTLGRSLNKPSFSAKGAAVGSGLLLGITAATSYNGENLSAISFNLLATPTSSALTVDMPTIGIDSPETISYIPKLAVRAAS